jgi:phage replication-related protein YjqB (UPF0714/DUF867 family)
VGQRDKYRSFAELASDNQEGLDYNRRVEMRDSEIAIIAPHGGGIEPGTSEIAEALAGGEFALYCFEGCRCKGNEELHIISTRFDEPLCAQLVERHQVVVAVHGCAGKHEAVYIGGLDDEIRSQVVKALKGAGFEAKEDVSNHSGSYVQNICNKGKAGRGVQLEITEGLRRTMFRGLQRHEREVTKPPFDRFIAAIRAVLFKAQEEKSDETK